MKQDIRQLFNTSSEDEVHNLPDNHRDVFLNKLRVQQQPKTIMKLWLKIAAVLVVALAVTFGISEFRANDDELPMLAQIEAVEAEYLKNIATEWDNFVRLTDDEHLIARFKTKLSQLDADYQELSKAFKDDANNIFVVENLIDNLQTRLQLLKDIQRHINILNQNNEQHENTI